MRYWSILALCWLFVACSPLESLKPKPPLVSLFTFAPADTTITAEPRDVEQACSVFEQRLKAAGEQYFEVRCKPDAARIEVALPENTDHAYLTDLLTKRGVIELIDPLGQYFSKDSLVCTDTYPTEPKTSEPTETHCDNVYHTIVHDADFMRDEMKLTKDVVGNPATLIHLNDTGAAAFEAFSTANNGNNITLVVDRQVITSLTINGIASHEMIITFGTTKSKREQEAEAQKLLSIIKNPSLPFAWQLAIGK